MKKIAFKVSVYSFIIHSLSVTACPLQGHWNQSQLTLGEGGVHPGLDKWPVHHRSDIWRQTTIHTHIHTYEQFRFTSKPNLHVWTVVGSQSTQTELMQS